MHSIFAIVAVCLINDCVWSINITISPDYILANTTLKLTCNIGENITDREVVLYRNGTLFGSYNRSICSDSAACIPGIDSLVWQYTPATTLTQSYYCSIDSTIESNIVTVKKAELPSSATLSPTGLFYNITLGQNTSGINCFASKCWPICAFRWTGPNMDIIGQTLLLANIQTFNEGLYRCQATNVLGVIYSANVSFTVQYGPTNAYIQPSITSYTLTEGQLLTVQCTAVCSPSCDYKWTYPDGTVYNSNSVSIIIQKSHHGSFVCTALNNIGNATKTFSVTVNYGPTRADIQPSTSSYTLTEGLSLTVLCSAICNPSCDYEWIYPDGKVYSSNTVSIVVQKTHNGSFLCTASNVIGNATKTFSVTVNYGPTNANIQPSTASYLLNEGELLPPVRCLAECNPSCDYNWTYPDGTVYSTNTVSVSLQKSHHGVFGCTASNSFGIATKAFSVTVNYKPEKITVSTPFTTILINEFTNISITCSADCRPTCLYLWNGPAINISTSILYIGSINRQQAGQYNCKAYNSIGYLYWYINVTVHTKPSQAQMLTATCTSPRTASVAWIPDLTVVPAEIYTLQYGPYGGKMTNLTFTSLSELQRINVMHINDLTPATNYLFLVSSKNIRGEIFSYVVNCTTAEAERDSLPNNGTLIGGIVMIVIATLIIAISFIILIYKLRRHKTDTSLTSCIQFLDICLARCRKMPADSAHDYENYQRPINENTKVENNKNEDENDKNNPYQDLQPRASIQNPYDGIRLTPQISTSTHKGKVVALGGQQEGSSQSSNPSSDYVNLRNLKAQKTRKVPKYPKKAVLPPNNRQKK